MLVRRDLDRRSRSIAFVLFVDLNRFRGNSSAESPVWLEISSRNLNSIIFCIALLGHTVGIMGGSYHPMSDTGKLIVE